MGRVNDYDPVADLYDAYVRADFDLDFFSRRVAASSGPVLELMAGTGRVTRAIYPTHPDIICVDLSLEMLRFLINNLGTRPGLCVVCADVRSLPFARDYFKLALIPFNSFAELTTTHDQADALIEIHRVLAPGGRLIVTLHNPAVRRRSLDDRERLLGEFELESDRRLEVWVQAWEEAGSGIAVSRQTYRVSGAGGDLELERVWEVRFALISGEGFTSLAEAAGLEIVELLGDYGGSAFAPDDSPYMIWTLGRR